MENTRQFFLVLFLSSFLLLLPSILPATLFSFAAANFRERESEDKTCWLLSNKRRIILRVERKVLPVPWTC